MKIKLLLCFIALSMTFASCTNEEDEAIKPQTIKISAEIDALSDDVSQIIEEEFRNRQQDGRPAEIQSLLPSCASVTTTTTAEMWTSIINFGDAGCTLQNGNVLKGSITVSGSTDFDQPSYEVSYSFTDFYHNDRLVQGSRNVIFTWESTSAQTNPHTVANIDLDFTVIYPNGNEYLRTGHRVRELIEGYNTPFDWTDNKYQVTGQWATTFPQGTINTTIGTPLVYNVQCGYIASGTLEFSTASNNALLDYGNGLCDYFATLTVNGGNETTINLN